MQGMHSRWPGYDHHRPGAYFGIVCTHRRELLFDEPRLRRVAEALWQRILRHTMARHCMACHFPPVQPDAWVVMATLEVIGEGSAS
jgi:hypothetical protein